MGTPINGVIDPLIKRKIFLSEEEAIRELLREYILKHIDILTRKTGNFEQKYKMNFKQFDNYLHERSALLENASLTFEQRKLLGRSIMIEEDDFLDWKSTLEMLENWLGIQKEAL